MDHSDFHENVENWLYMGGKKPYILYTASLQRLSLAVDFSTHPCSTL